MAHKLELNPDDPDGENYSGEREGERPVYPEVMRDNGLSRFRRPVEERGCEEGLVLEG
jgi:hypothetical protein